MASMYREDGGFTIRFADPNNGERKKIRLGDVTKKQAQGVKWRVEQLSSAKLTGHTPDDEILKWLETIPDLLHDRISAAGLARPRQSGKLGPWLAKYMEERTDLKPESRRKLQQTVAKLVEHFGAETSLRSVTPEGASEWRAKMQKAGLSEATLKIHAGNAKTLAAAAKERRLTSENPFLHLPSGPTPSKNERYITPEEAQAIIDACPDRRFRLIFALARYAGLRIRSEGFALTWRDIDWGGSKMRVKSPKTERHAGHEERWVPITPKLLPILREAYENAEEGAERVVPIKWTGMIPERMLAAVIAAGVKPWPKLFQALRASCEKEWAMRWPQYAVSSWLGHSMSVSGRHYLNKIPVELFERAAGKVGQIQGRKQAILGGIDAKQKNSAEEQIVENSAENREIPQLAGSCQVGDEGLEPPTSSV